MAQKVLITGDSGALAQRVKHLLLEKGYDVITLTTNKKKTKLKFIVFERIFI